VARRFGVQSDPVEIGTRETPMARLDQILRCGAEDPEVVQDLRVSPIEWCIPPGSQQRNREGSNRATCLGVVAARSALLCQRPSGAPSIVAKDEGRRHARSDRDARGEGRR